MAKPVEELVRRVRRLAYAQAAFKQTAAMAGFLEAHPHSDEEEWYAAATAGLCTTYMRPFMDGLGALSAKYEKFEDGDLLEMHKDLRRGRNWIFAHHDVAGLATLLSDDFTRFEPITVRVLPGANVRYSLSRIKFSRERLPVVKLLCAEQIARTVADLAKVTIALAGGVKYPVGEYVLGKNFP